MAKKSGDIILRDRLQFTLDTNGDLTARYGRVNLDDYVNIVARKGLMLKEIHFQLIQQSPTDGLNMTNTGIVPNVGTQSATIADSTSVGGLKVWATTEAYENGFDVGISSPNVYTVWERYWQASVVLGGAGEAGYSTNITENYYGVTDLHPEGAPLISDLLIGIAADNMDIYDDDTIQLDIMMVFEPKTFTVTDFTDMLAQQQDV